MVKEAAPAPRSLADPVERVHRGFRDRVSRLDLPDRGGTLATTSLTAEELVGLFRSQTISRHVDRMARVLRGEGVGYYTIASSGHEGMAAVAAALRPDDMAFLHYRDGAFQVARANQVAGQDPIRDLLLSLVASLDDPISGGRHKVLGSKTLVIPPQTSTIASHLPKAVGAAYSIGLARRVKPEHQALADDGLVVCTFGDASLNHASAQAAINAAGWTAFQGGPLPLLLVCEDNGVGISVRTPEGWVEASMSGRAGIGYVQCDGLDLIDTYEAVAEAAADVRRQCRPVFVHLGCVRLYGHAGADVQAAYLTEDEIRAAEGDDPLLHSARTLIDRVGLLPEEVVAIYDEMEREVVKAAEEVREAPTLDDRDAVMASILPPPRPCSPARPAVDRRQLFSPADLQAMTKPQNMGRLLNWTLTDLMNDHPEVVVAGEDVGAKGGVYGITQRLHGRFGSHRVIDTLLDEQSILGLAIGMAHNGFVPVPEIQFLAYLHNAEDQIRGEAATLPFFSRGQYTNPMVVRVPGLGYQRGFGGHFHNDNSIAVLRDIPGLIVACPSNGADASEMLRESVRLAREEQRVVVFLEPIARYSTTDLLEEGDQRWSSHYLPPSEGRPVRLGEVGLIGSGTDLAIVTYGNGTFLAAQAQADLRRQGVGARIVDMRWLSPLPLDAVLDATASSRSVLVVDEGRESGSLSEAIVTGFAERAKRSVVRLCGADSFIATGPAAAATLPSREGIVTAARRCVDR